MDWILLRQQAKRPEPPPDTTKNGEQDRDWGALDVIESFDVDEFQAAMVRSNEPSCYLDGEDTTTKDDPIVEALESAIVFFETFCLKDDFEAHAMDDEPNAPCTTVESVPIKTIMPVPANKAPDYSTHHAPVMKDTMVHIEYPDRTKFVSSMNHEQYEELKTYNDLDGGTSVSDESFVLRFDMRLCDALSLSPFEMLGSDRISIGIGLSH